METHNITHASHQLQQQISGRVITPQDTDYAQARLAWNRSLNHHPALIVQAQTADDVAAAVRFAREAHLGVTIQSTGHGLQQAADDALLIVTSAMTGVTVDAQAKTARAEAGALWHHVLAKTTPHGLAPLLGSSPYVGVMGYTLGGGIGWLARKYGFAADSVRSIDVVTPDGVLRHASASENRDLFWALRGSGGNFGVVTAIEFDLYPVAEVYGGSLVYNGDQMAEALHFYRDWIKHVPDELTSSIMVIKFPNLPMLPEALRGTKQVIVRAVYVGDPQDGVRLMQPWLDWKTPINNSFEVLPFSEIGKVSNDPVDPVSGHGSNELLDELSDGIIDVIVSTMTNPATPMAMTELRHAGGAISRVAPDTSAIGFHGAQIFLQTGGPVPNEAGYNASVAAIEIYKAALRPYVRGDVYINFMKGHEAAERAKDAYSPETLARLIALKAQYDPENLFRYGYQLVPTHA